MRTLDTPHRKLSSRLAQEGSVPASLSAEARERIDVANYEIHRDFDKKLAPLAHSPLEFISSGVAFSGPHDPRPKQPFGLSKILASYAVTLFNAEAIEYPASPEIQTWFSELAIRVEENIILRVVTQRLAIFGEFTYHASEDTMREAIRNALRTHLQEERFPNARVKSLPSLTARLVDPERWEEPIQPVGRGYRWTPQNPEASNDIHPEPEPTPEKEDHQKKTFSERLDQLVTQENISHEELAHQIGVPRSTYFDIKAGRGGRRTRRKVEDYLSKHIK
jgi:hypothetical protein